VKHLVELHGGSVNAESRGEGKGAVFTVTLPCANALAATQAAASATTVTHIQQDVANLTGIRVLLIDDVLDVRDAMSAMLQSFGAEVTAAASVAEGLAALSRFKPDVVFCDIGIPGEDGFSFVRRLRALKPDQGGKTPVAALSAYAGPEHAKRSLEAGFDLHLSKPADAEDLARVVLQLASRRVRPDGGTGS
jgi:CheY-like chemotaxis protein